MNINKKGNWSRPALILLMLLGLHTISFAQNNPRRSSGEINKPEKERRQDKDDDTSGSSIKDASFWDRVTFGGNLGASFGQVTYVNISPLVGYRVTEDFTAGAGFTYMYFNDKYYNYSTSMYGPRLFGQYAFFSNLLAYGELELLNIEYYNEVEQRLARTWIANPLVGGGYRAAIGPRSYMNIFILYNLNWNANKDISPYQSPIIFRIGFSL